MSQIRNILNKSKTQKIVDHHISGIPDKLKRIDPKYFVVMNNSSGKFEVHNDGNQGSSYCFETPDGVLDDRTIEYARKTASHRGDDFIKEMDRNNEKAEKDQAKAFREEIAVRSEVLSWAIKKDVN